MFRRDPLRQALTDASDLLGRDVRPLLGAARGVFRRGGVLAVTRAGLTLTVPLGRVPADGLFELASVTKPFTAALGDALARQGILDWDAPLARLGGPLRGLPPHLTARRLATHTSGLPMHPARVALTALTRYSDPYGGMSAAAVLGSARRWAHTARPGRFGYSNLGVGVLALALAHAAGDDPSAAGYDRALRRLVTGPLGVPVTLTPGGRPVVTPVGPLGGPQVTGFGPLAGAGGLFGAAGDLLTFGRAHLNGHAGTHWQRPLHPAGLPAALSGVAPGWFQSGAGTLWHDGVARGTRAGLGFRPDTGAVVALLVRGGMPVVGRRGEVPALLLALLHGDPP